MKRTVTLARKNGNTAQSLYPVTEASLVSHERGDASPSSAKIELDGLNDALQGPTPGLVARVNELERTRFRPYASFQNITPGELFVCPSDGVALFHAGGKPGRCYSEILAEDGETLLAEVGLDIASGAENSCTFLLPKGAGIRCTELSGDTSMCRFLPLVRENT